MRVYNWLKHTVPAWIWITLLVALVLLIGADFSYRHWDWLASPIESGGESASTTIRNIALVLAGFVALILALWRGATGGRENR